jgi:Cu(I)/Ag(I) efflux system membrane fusion protein
MRVVFLFSLLLTVMACNSPKAPVQKAPATSTLSKAGTDKVMGLLVQYYELKNALVASDAKKAAASSAKLQAMSQDVMVALKAEEGKAETGAGDDLNKIAEGCKTIAATDDATCERQRVVFAQVSTGMYDLLQAISVKNSGAYKQFCPMAFNDKGAYWLSEEEEIKNPYFGKKMLECGEVQDSL